MQIFKNLMQQTFIYGIASVLPRVLSFLLVVVHTRYLQSPIIYGRVTIIFSWIIFLNVILSYGMETAFFRFLSDPKYRKEVTSTAALSLLATTSVLIAGFYASQSFLSTLLGVETQFINLMLLVLGLDALAIIPFAQLRAEKKALRFAYIKSANVICNVGLNIFFLILLPQHFKTAPWAQWMYRPNFAVQYIFIANIAASAFTLLLLLPFYWKLSYRFHKELWVKMIRYGLPILVSGLAFAINEHFDKIILERILQGKAGLFASGTYAACYKLGLFMTLFTMAFKLGVEPFFFSQAKSKNAETIYARITEYFVLFGVFILITVITFIDLLKSILIQNKTYWEAIGVIPFILLANLCLGIYHNLSVWYKINDKTIYGAYFSIAGAFITLLLNFVLIPRYTYMGSAIATCAAYGLMMLLSWYFGQKNYPIPYNLRKIGTYLLSAIGLVVLIFYVFERNYWFSIPIWLCYTLILLVTERKNLMQLWNN